jgi:hypothetical protein
MLGLLKRSHNLQQCAHTSLAASSYSLNHLIKPWHQTPFTPPCSLTQHCLALHAAGGFVFLRPCRAVYDHMVEVATKEERLQFADLHAEQTFIEW